VEITGAILHSEKLSPPNRQLKKLYEATIALNAINHSSDLAISLASQIKGRKTQINQIAAP
jgi:hypothetical protein